MIPRLADWVTIVSGPLSVLATIATWRGWVADSSPRGARASLVDDAVTLLIVVVVWAFLFFASLRVAIAFQRQFSDMAALSLSFLVSGLMALVFAAMEIMVVETVLAPTPLVTIAWLAGPLVLWIGAAYWAIFQIVGGEYERDVA